MHRLDPALQTALELLDVGADANPGQVAEAYRRKARTAHPDVNDAPDAVASFQDLAAAYRIALEAARRHETAERIRIGTSGLRPPDETLVGADDVPTHHDPPLVLGVVEDQPAPRGRSATSTPLVAGPVVIHPPASNTEQDPSSGGAR
ncbi:MAG TPA: DnaJ domain-containing protein [Nocardioidaceae bacterium]|jgi:hypothetical protein